MQDHDREDGWQAAALTRMGYLGLIQADFTTFRVRGDRDVGRVFGVDPERMVDGIHLDCLDRAYFADDFEVVKQGRRSPAFRSGAVRYQFRLRRLDGGSPLWIRSMSHRSVGSDGRVLEVTGALFDVTAEPQLVPSLELAPNLTCGTEPQPVFRSVSELDTLSGHLMCATRSARTLGLRGLEADLRAMLGFVGTALSRRLRLRTHH